MKEPILSREEAFKFARCFEGTENVDNIPAVVALTPLELEQFVSAVLEKLCGEPIYQIGDGNELWRDVEKNEFDSTHHARIVYALNRSKA
ncbi:hypothetical protein KTE57_17315 [Burkholderia multivorans]|uniref:hypothetical protein n=1 Tax=Burkholderia multivorans TaxID=87883 RepID=UPI001C241C50|nr:hypothetical protein [Burkholderia multivorans]MBU9461332.1 hypothetical protein [Burkholderia multivorans]